MPKKNRSDFCGFLRLPYLSCFNLQGTNREPMACFVFSVCQKFMLGMPSPLFRQASMLCQIHLSPRTRQILQDFNFIFLIQALTNPLKIWSNKKLPSEMVQHYGCRVPSEIMPKNILQIQQFPERINWQTLRPRHRIHQLPGNPRDRIPSNGGIRSVNKN